jgi:hypothetical protein
MRRIPVLLSVPIALCLAKPPTSAWSPSPQTHYIGYNYNNNNNLITPNPNQGSHYSPSYYNTNAATSYDPSSYYLNENDSSNEVDQIVDQIVDKNFDAPPVATAMTGGLPFISYALRGIAWLFVVGTLFLMFVGTISAAFYRWTKAYASGREFAEIEATDFVMKAVELWNYVNL